MGHNECVIHFRTTRKELTVSATATKSIQHKEQTHGNGASNGVASKIKSFPAPSQLATPTDLKPEQVKAVTEAVNPLIADAMTLYFKTKNFHWHLSGKRFRDLHLLFDEHAAQILESIDPMAERVRKIGGTTLRSLSHAIQLQTVSDDNEDFVEPSDMVARLMEDNRHIVGAIRKAAKTAEDNDDIATANMLEEILDATERRTWFLFEISQTMEK
jgi:starvation-inducible DNA-binding protein